MILHIKYAYGICDSRIFSPATDFLNRRLDLLTEKYLQLSEIIYRRNKAVFPICFSFILISIPSLVFIGREGSGGIKSDTISASVELKTGTNLERTEAVVTKIENKIKKHPDVLDISSNIKKSHAEFHIKINTGKHMGKGIEDYADEISQIGKSVQDASFFTNGASEGESSEELNIDFYGSDLKTLRKIAEESSDLIQSHVEGIQQSILRFKGPGDDILIYPDSVKIFQSEASNEEIGNILRTLLSGIIATKFYDKNREVDVRILAERQLFNSPERIKEAVIPSSSHGVRLKSISIFEDDTGETKIWRKNKRKMASITLRIRGRSIDRVAGDIQNLFSRHEFPSDITYSFGDEYEKIIKTQKDLSLAVIGSIILVYFLLGALFESFRLPLLVLATTPLAIFLIIDIYFLSGIALNISILTGLIMLSGIMVNTSIILASTIDDNFKMNNNNYSHRTKYKCGGINTTCNEINLYKEIFRISATRIRPILMTTITTVLGMLPMIWDFREGSEMWRNLAITVSSGLILSTMMNLILLPFFYYQLNKKIILRKSI